MEQTETFEQWEARLNARVTVREVAHVAGQIRAITGCPKPVPIDMALTVAGRRTDATAARLLADYDRACGEALAALIDLETAVPGSVDQQTLRTLMAPDRRI